MGDPITIGAILKAGADIAGAASEAKRNSLLIEFQQITVSAFSQLAELQMQNARLQSEKLALEQECMRLKDWSAKKVGYRTREIAPGVFAEVRNDASGPLQSVHKLCTNCFSKSIESPLQQSNATVTGVGRVLHLTCPNGCPKLQFFEYLE